MAFSNNMTKLLNKAARRLHLRLIIPKLEAIDLGKDVWAAEAIIEDSLPTFSKYFPRKIPFIINRNTPKDEDGYMFIDEELAENQEIIGIQDLDFKSLSNNQLTYMQDIGYGFVDEQALQGGLSVEDIANVQMASDLSSLFNNGIYINSMPPNKFKLVSSTGNNISFGLRSYNIFLLVTHNSNLITIPPTQMETFEQLCFSDIATLLLGTLKYYDGLETIFTNVDLQLSILENWSEKREEIVNKLDEAHVSASNDACPVLIVV